MSDREREEWYADGLHFTCHQCGNCCTGPPGYVWFTDEEAEAMAAYLELSHAEFIQQYTHRAHGERSLNEIKTDHGFDCVFLRRDDQGKALCGIYPVRPKQCATWPFWPENLKRETDWLRAARNCEGMEAGMSAQGKFFPIDQIRVIRDSHTDD